MVVRVSPDEEVPEPHRGLRSRVVSESDSSAVPSTTRRPAPDPPRATPPAGGSPGAIVRWTVDMINARDAAACVRCGRRRIRVRFPPRTVHGVDELEAWWTQVFDAVPDLR